MTLHGYYRSGSAWRVRIALGLKGLEVRHVFYHLRRDEHLTAAYRALNPQALLPTLELADGRVLTQSLAIIEWLDAIHPAPPLLPSDPFERAKVRGFALAIAADTHPVQNLRVLNAVRALGAPEATVTTWAATVNEGGLAACEALVRETTGPFCFGAAPGLADICLVPMLGNARRFGVALDPFPRLLAAEAACQAIPAFAAAVPSAQPDAE